MGPVKSKASARAFGQNLYLPPSHSIYSKSSVKVFFVPTAHDLCWVIVGYSVDIFTSVRL